MTLNYEYYVDEEKRTVACKLHNARHKITNNVSVFLKNTGACSDGIEAWMEACSLVRAVPHAISAVAKCDPRDEFDVEFGKKLARARVDQKVRSRTHTIITDYRLRTVQNISRMNDEIATHAKKCVATNLYVAGLAGYIY